MDLTHDFPPTGQTQLEPHVIRTGHLLDIEQGGQGRASIKSCPKLVAVLGNSCCHIKCAVTFRVLPICQALC